jgi:glycosyltransferase involved in cell wall biosynthesis
MREQELPKTIFVGYGPDMISYYRCFLPAVALGADYAAWVSDIKVSSLSLVTGLGPQPPKLEDLFDYEVVVVQQARGLLWLNLIRELQAAGVVVLYEIDDYVHSARKTKSHEMSETLNAEFVRQMELSMHVADGIICSTDYLARRYRSHSERTWTCPNGIDLPRYAHPRIEREGVTIGWSGGVGHKASLERWAPALRSVLRSRPETRFMSAGYWAATEYIPEFGPERAIAVPPAKLEVYPATLSLFDIAFAPSAENNLFRGKSDLRWLEASAAGVPLIAHPDVYPEIEDGVTGMHARTPAEAEAAMLELVDDRELRERIGAQARAYVTEHRRSQVAAERWRTVLLEFASVAA